MAYSAVPTVTTGELWTAAQHNTYIRDNFTELNSRSFARLRVPAYSAYNNSDTVAISLNAGDTGQFILPDNKNCYVYGNFMLPTVGTLTIDVSAIVYSVGTGNLYSKLDLYYGDIGGTESYDENSSLDSLVATGVTALKLETVNTRAALALSTSDLLTMVFYRNGASANDTTSASLSFFCFLVDINIS